MAFCGGCGKALDENSQFCASCGKPTNSVAQQSSSAMVGTVPITPSGMYCPHCGSVISKEAEICPKCGVRVKQAPPAYTEQKKNPGIAAVLSVVFVGLGQIYNGQIGKGILFIILGIVFLALIIVLVGFILAPVFWIYNIYDAYSTAKKINAGIIKQD